MRIPADYVICWILSSVDRNHWAPTYAVRRIRDAFRENKNVKDPAEIQALVNKAKRDLGIIRRQGLTDVLHSLLKSTSYLRLPLRAWIRAQS
eukprot:XP_022270115.1 LYR motif-containing protein 4 isoform X7 [Canis lupus familiaris]